MYSSISRGRNCVSRSALFQLVLARWRSFYREPGVLFWSFGFPIVLAIALGIAFRNRPPQPVEAAVETGPHAIELQEALTSNDVKVQILDPERARAALRTGKVDIVITSDNERTYRFDPQRPESRIARAFVDDHLQRAAGRADAFTSADNHVVEPGSRYIDFLIPGLIGIGLMQGGLWGVGYVIVEMRTRKLMKRLLATPMRKRDFLLAFVLMRALFLVVELPILLGFASLVFDVPIRGSIAAVALITILGSLSFAGLGLLIASRAENIQTASGLINLASMPMFITSGTFFASTRFPDAMQPFVRALPLTAMNEALRAIMLDGASLVSVSRSIVVLALWGAIAFFLALRFFKWR
jgi:ABC-2 type transport system permease protein